MVLLVLRREDGEGRIFVAMVAAMRDFSYEALMELEWMKGVGSNSTVHLSLLLLCEENGRENRMAEMKVSGMFLMVFSLFERSCKWLKVEWWF